MVTSKAAQRKDALKTHLFETVLRTVINQERCDVRGYR